jgi:hypothetical protein
MHLLTWVGFDLIGYVSNTLYTMQICEILTEHSQIMNSTAA